MTSYKAGNILSRGAVHGINFGNGGPVTKLLIEKGFISEEEFRKKLMEERATYQKILNPTQK
jgi:hypothetical protein